MPRVMTGASRPDRRAYFSVRTGRSPEHGKIDLPTLTKMFVNVYTNLHKRKYLFEATAHQMGGSYARQAEYAFVRLRKEGLWPPKAGVEYSEDDVFDLVEFTYDHVSMPIVGQSQGGFLSDAAAAFVGQMYDKEAGQEEFRLEINALLRDYRGGWELNERGEILALPDEGLSDLTEAELKTPDEKNVKAVVRAAIRKFHLRGATAEDRKDAVRDLGNVLEFLRTDAKQLLTSKDEDDLFQILNAFGLRHHRRDQKGNYDQDVFMPTLFYYYLNMVHLVLRLQDRHVAAASTTPPTPPTTPPPAPAP